MENTENKTNTEVKVEAETATNLINIEDFFKAELRVAEIIDVNPIEKSNKLLKLQVSLGEKLGERQVLAGIAKHYSKEDLIGKKIIIVANLKPAKLMGEESQGMILAVDGFDNDVVLLQPAKDAPLGAQVR